MPERHIVHPRRLAVAGVALAAAVAFAGFGLEAWRLGPNDAAAARKIEARVRTLAAPTRYSVGALDRVRSVRRRLAPGASISPRARAGVEQYSRAVQSAHSGSKHSSSG